VLRWVGWIADADAEFVEGSKDVGVAAQEAGHEDAEQQDYERHDYDQSNHLRLLLEVRPQYSTHSEPVKMVTTAQGGPRTDRPVEGGGR
jgi:hypothetical protein